MKLIPYLFFNGNCEDALNFYMECLGGEFESVNYFKDGPEEMGGRKVASEMMNKVMHMTWRFGDNNVLMASDGMDKAATDSNITLSVNMNDAIAMRRVFNKMSNEGIVTMPLEDTFWGAKFGMLTDKYGFKWMFNCEKEK